MQYACGNCGAMGHNRRTCDKLAPADVEAPDGLGPYNTCPGGNPWCPCSRETKCLSHVEPA